MCVSTGPRICLVCLLLYSWHARAEEPDIGGIPLQYDDIHTKPDIPAEVDDDTSELYFMEKDYFLTKLMNKYGNGVEMTYEGFEHLLYHLGLGGVLKFDHSVSCHKVDNSSEFLQIHLHHNHSAEANQSSRICLHEEEHSHEHKHVVSHDHSHDDHEHTHNEQEHLHGDNEHNVKDKGIEHEDKEDHDHEGHSHDHGDHEHNQDHNMHHDDNLEHSIVEHEHDEKENSTAGVHNHSDHDDSHEHDHLDHNHNHKEIEDETHVHNHTVDQNIHTEGDIHEGHDHDHDGEHDHGEELYHGGEHGHDHGGEHDHAEEHGHDHGGEHDHAEEHEHDHGGEHDHAEEHDHGGEHEHDHGGEHEHDHGDADHEHHRRKRHTEYDECLPAKLMLRLVQNDDQPRSLTKEMFKELCPSLIYQIDANTCHSSHSNNAHGDHDRFHDHGGHDHNDHDHAVHAESSAIDLSKVPPKVWGYSTIAVVIISLVGLLGVAVIPIMQKVFYNHMLQFLVAMAVGALSGDALLHLFPHAIAGGHGDEHGGHSHGEEGHYHDPAPIYKGLLGLFGIYFFFFTERVLTMFTEYKRKKKQKKNHNKYMKDEEMVKVGEKLANSECDGMMMSIHPNKALKGYADEAHTEHCTISFENTTRISHQHGQRQNCTEETCVDGDENTSMIGSVNSTPKSHGHRHGHSHGVDGVPDSVASVAWMVILGDGIHNFSDGLAIGAAFVNSITGGFSTSIAVFCHELPHEIGDFAMLLRAGMSPKQAIIYNCLSSILCFIGMLIGVAIGNLEGASLWIFSIVGGMFLYIALVDMLPELSAVETKKGEHPLCHLLLQGIGMCLGAGIMLAIALYEGELKTMLD